MTQLSIEDRTEGMRGLITAFALGVATMAQSGTTHDISAGCKS